MKTPDGPDFAELERQRKAGADIESVVMGDRAGKQGARRVPIYERWGTKQGKGEPCLDARQVDAAKEFRAMYELAEASGAAISNYDGEPVPESFLPRAPSDRLICSVYNWVRLKAHIGQTNTTFLVAFCALEQPPEIISRWQRARYQGHVQAALNQVADYLGL
jgi:hypothetical protein